MQIVHDGIQSSDLTVYTVLTVAWELPLHKVELSRTYA